MKTGPVAGFMHSQPTEENKSDSLRNELLKQSRVSNETGVFWGTRATGGLSLDMASTLVAAVICMGCIITFLPIDPRRRLLFCRTGSAAVFARFPDR